MCPLNIAIQVSKVTQLPLPIIDMKSAVHTIHEVLTILPHIYLLVVKLSVYPTVSQPVKVHLIVHHEI